MEQEKTIAAASESEFIPEIEARQTKIDALRLDGVTKIEALKNENSNIRRNRALEKEVKEELIAHNKEEIDAAYEVAQANSGELHENVREAIAFIQDSYKPLIDEKKSANAQSNLAAKQEYEELRAGYIEERKNQLAKEDEAYNSGLASAESPKDFKKEHKMHIDDIELEFRQKCNDANVRYNDVKEANKDALHQLYLNKFSAIEKANNKKLPLLVELEQRIENYSYTFNIKSFFLKNGLYLAILFLMIIATIYYAIAGYGFLFNWDNIILILNQVSPKMFLALGVGGLIVLAGTDLSVGRLVGMASVFTGMLVTTDGTTTVKFFGVSPNFSAIPLGLRVVLAFVISILACCLITTIAGFFTAKFKMHPFISTLATQLFTFGLIAGITQNSFTGNPDPTVKAIVSGKGLGSNDFPIMIIWAIIGIAVMWFIWNKTKFGKNMFAVGGNAEAAAVSGINVFKVTLMVFVLAGIYYGIGGSIYGIYTGNVRAQTGQGMESDAIAACVVGGVSFSGGVGKISGIVIGALVFQIICVVLPLIGITDSNYQLAIKGVIILAAVTLDCVKYLKKK